ncbi:hypothetical protein WAB97_002775 [Stenotrophomonas maltophilia]|uniref:hypothetical protein n=1 Tax=Stenotrophomonas maltophilia TaxID=40324 RepID=UPI00332A620F
MPERLPDHPHLHALLCAAVRDLPAALAETLEGALREFAEFVTPSAFFAHLAATAGTCAPMVKSGVECA